MERVIEVIGSASYELHAVAFPVELVFSTSSKGRVDRYKVHKAIDGFVVELAERGFDLDRLSHGGAQTRNWNWSGSRSRAEIKLRMLCESAEEAARLSAESASIPHDGAGLDIDAKKPIFEAGDEKRGKAFADATRKGIALAQQVSDVSGVRLGKLHSMRELNNSVRNSGYGDDFDYGEHSQGGVVMMAAAGAVASPRGEIASARTVNLLLRFEVLIDD